MSFDMTPVKQSYQSGLICATNVVMTDMRKLDIAHGRVLQNGNNHYAFIIATHASVTKVMTCSR
jgi:hypothetical protein